ncbi:hypothetical protein SELMODRAFT_430414 [Selaginella moellendorffii]|uniref:Uncharacterized protein n=1 Tax=Selaginella moellendorffii TaxID=88036 RepID=D8T9C3_SELML|nr:hypothetical protein SELMODRAFT_430414 [Selaginella moellendorffii]
MAATAAAAALGGEISMTNKTRRREIFAARSSNASPKSGNQALCYSKGSPTYIQEFESRSSAEEIHGGGANHEIEPQALGKTYKARSMPMRTELHLRAGPALYIVVGDGGNTKTVDTEHADDPGKCPKPEDNVKNNTHALWTWYRNQDVYGDSRLGDIVKSPQCRNYPAFQADERSGGNSGSPSRILGALAILMASLLEF